ncbi:MAG: hypothetical protein F4X72_01460 [Dehalococcoidia bacterium]|nr:hypothetical protein [Dehalococcoidia bacterium]
MIQRYVVVFEQSLNNYSAYVPELPGCVSTGDSWEEIQETVRETITFHIAGMVMGGEPLPKPEMPFEEAETYHNKALSEYAKDLRAEFGDEGPELPTIFRMVEVEVANEALGAVLLMDSSC